MQLMLENDPVDPTKYAGLPHAPATSATYIADPPDGPTAVQSEASEQLMFERPDPNGLEGTAGVHTPAVSTATIPCCEPLASWKPTAVQSMGFVHETPLNPPPIPGTGTSVGVVQTPAESVT
jgi:hypothetical protein